MVFVGLVPTVIGEQAIGQAVGQTVLCNAVAAHSMVGAADFGTHTFGDIRALHDLFLRVSSAFCIAKMGDESAQKGAVQRIVRPFPIFSRHNDPALAQDLHVVRECRLGNIQVFKNLTGTQLATAQHCKDFKARFVAQRFEYFRVFASIQVSPRIDDYLYYICRIDICQYNRWVDLKNFYSFDHKS